MDRGLVFMSAFMIVLGISPLLVGCKTADEGPKPFVMPAKPVLNLPSTTTGQTKFTTPSIPNPPSNTTQAKKRRSPPQLPADSNGNATPSRAN